MALKPELERSRRNAPPQAPPGHGEVGRGALWRAGQGSPLSLGSTLGRGRWPLLLLLLLVASLALLPILGLAPYALLGGIGAGAGGEEALAHTTGLVLMVGLGSALLGTATGWLTSACSFPGRRLLRIAQLLPLAAPPYLLAATLIDGGSRFGLRLHGDLWAAAVLILGTYSYVFLLATESFSAGGQRQLEACRSLGVGPWGSFRRVALPMAAPAIVVGVALSGMVVLNDLWAV